MFNLQQTVVTVEIEKDVEVKPGMLTWDFEAIEVQGKHVAQDVTVNILRVNGSKGAVSVKLSTEKQTAVAGRDYEEIENQEVVFNDGETHRTVVLSILEKLRTQLTIESNSLLQQNLVGYLIVNLKLKLREERESQIHIPSWKLPSYRIFDCSYVWLRFSIRYSIRFCLRRELDAIVGQHLKKRSKRG